NPDVQFDWTRILKSPQQPAQEQGRREDRRDRRRDQNRPPAPAQLPAASFQPPASSFQLPADRSEAVEPEPVEPESCHPTADSDPNEPGELAEPGEPEPPEASSREPEAESWQPEAGSWRPPADSEPRYARLGAEGLARLRARYAEVMARISEKPIDEPVKDELRAKAERLNPDAWVTEEEVASALEQYETVFEQLRPLVGRHP